MDYQLEQDSYSKLEVQGLLDRYVQSECDKVRTDYSKKLKTAEDERDALKPKDKSETELVLDKRATELSKRERMLALKEINVYPQSLPILYVTMRTFPNCQTFSEGCRVAMFRPITRMVAAQSRKRILAL